MSMVCVCWGSQYFQIILFEIFAFSQLLSILEKPEKVSARKIKEVNKLDQTLKEMVSLLVTVVQYLHNKG